MKQQVEWQIHANQVSDKYYRLCSEVLDQNSKYFEYRV